MGLTFRERERYAAHMLRGPVFEHIKVCPTFEYKIVETALQDPKLGGAAERRWIKDYETVWAMLNQATGGGTGSVHAKWTQELILEDASKYAYRRDWLLGNQFAYKLAKQRGWFDAAVAHMPRKRPVSNGPLSAAHRAKLSAAHRGKVLTQAHKDAIGEAARLVMQDPEVRARIGRSNLGSGRPRKVLTGV